MRVSVLEPHLPPWQKQATMQNKAAEALFPAGQPGGRDPYSSSPGCAPVSADMHRMKTCYLISLPGMYPESYNMSVIVEVKTAAMELCVDHRTHAALGVRWSSFSLCARAAHSNIVAHRPPSLPVLLFFLHLWTTTPPLDDSFFSRGRTDLLRKSSIMPASSLAPFSSALRSSSSVANIA